MRDGNFEGGLYVLNRVWVGGCADSEAVVGEGCAVGEGGGVLI